MNKRLHSLVLSLLLAAATGPAFGLGLGQIQVKSRMNEPLVADIPVITSDPSELAQLQARLASPDTFIRIGLPLPDRLVSDLHFQVIDGADGKPYIHVTSSTPVSQPLVNFLVEVDWGDGKLVREYSALVATPSSVVATAQPTLEAPTVTAAPVNTIDRSTAPSSAGNALAATPAPPAVVAKATPNVMPAAQPSRALAAASSAADFGPVRRGQTLGAIVSGLQNGGQDRDDVMQALVALNPDAFINGDRNRLRAGAVLRMPEGVQASAGASGKAGNAVARSVARAQIAKARTAGNASSRRPVDVANAPVTNTASADNKDNAASAKRVADARLRIVPAANGDAGSAGTKSGRGSSGGNGDMLQQLQQSQETIATRDAEITELKSRVGELEKLQQKQSQLIAMKSTELAAAQQKLAVHQATPAPAAGGFGLWWLLPAALAVALLAALWRLFGRRQGRAVTRGFATSAQAPVAATSTADAVPPAAVETPAPEVAAREDGLPTWARGDAWLPETAASHTQAHTTTAPDFPDAVTAVMDSRLQLARTYIGLGDVATARALLQDVQQEGDAAARAQAITLLDSLR
ncbi:type IV pilus assembly protein FimV [Solilutibacter silvestris]|uniref:type IV pilus assembly protein FimV n=1 Tax=Solilutibacter silvestris TaxID=1645665 RepID=UPI00101AE831|nr:FimV/HubP family polar landmark protein [Lysobacter silvestris]